MRFLGGILCAPAGAAAHLGVEWLVQPLILIMSLSPGTRLGHDDVTALGQVAVKILADLAWATATTPTGVHS